MRSIHATSGIPEDDAVDAEHSSCGATPLQTGRVPGRARRAASQLREGSYGRDLGTQPADGILDVRGPRDRIDAYTSNIPRGRNARTEQRHRRNIRYPP